MALAFVIASLANKAAGQDAQNRRPDCGVRPYMGVRVSMVNLPAASWVPSTSAKGARIDVLFRTGIAARLGLQVGDIILKINDTEIHGLPDEIKDILMHVQKDGSIRILYIRWSGGSYSPRSITGQMPPVLSLSSYVLDEAKGLPGVVVLGESYATIASRLGTPDYCGYTPLRAADGTTLENVLEASYPCLGLYLRFSGRSMGCDTIIVRWPFVGQTLHGLYTDATEKEAATIYGNPSNIIQHLNPDWRTLEYAGGYFSIGIDSAGNIGEMKITSAVTKH